MGKMSEKIMARLSLLCSLTGLAALYVAAANTRPAVTAIASLDENFVGAKVMISGKLIDLRAHADGHLFLKVKDDSGGTILVPVFARLRSQLKEPIELLDVVQVTGVVKKYRGELEVIPDKPSDLRVVHSSPARISNLSRENLGELIKVEGVVVERDIVGKGSLILTLREDSSQLPIFVPASVVKNGFPEIHVGSTVRVNGWLQLYKDKMEIQLKDASHIRVIETA
jgi:DNA/RNA endonuclease YhcR with UshA esterase domain